MNSSPAQNRPPILQNTHQLNHDLSQGQSPKFLKSLLIFVCQSYPNQNRLDILQKVFLSKNLHFVSSYRITI